MGDATQVMPVLKHQGFCPLCGRETTFLAQYDWFRDHLKCVRCGSVPRERALFAVLEDFYPNWRDLRVHESSPGNRGASPKLRAECANYSTSQFDERLELGAVDTERGFRNENLEALTFDDGSFDIFITQDVFEHIFRPDLAIKEIARTLRSGGAHVCTVPLVRKGQKSFRRAGNKGGDIVHFAEPQFHGNPVKSEGALVTFDWGYDICTYLALHSGLLVTRILIDDLDRGLRAEHLDVLICQKPDSVAYLSAEGE